ncbi:MAG TPA: cellulose-binding protein, partial [Verrucomicrobia bacterium]|nr:cellulose-binding protein [Verrucomicrobiota bacterium]
VLIDLGANDVISGVPLETTTENFILIIQRLRAVNPQVTILLAQTPPFEGQDKVAMRLLRRAIRSVAKRENTRESRVYVVNLFGGFSVKKDTFDGMHPDESGEQKIAKRFFKVLRRVLRRLR